MTDVVPGPDPSIRTVPVGLNTELRPLKRQGVDVDGVASKTTSENPVALWWKSYATDIVPGPDTSTNPSSEDAVASSVKKSIHIEKEMCVPLSLPITTTNLIVV